MPKGAAHAMQSLKLDTRQAVLLYRDSGINGSKLLTCTSVSECHMDRLKMQQRRRFCDSAWHAVVAHLDS